MGHLTYNASEVVAVAYCAEVADKSCHNGVS